MPSTIIQSSPNAVDPQRPQTTSPQWRLRIYTASQAYTGHGSPDPTNNLVAWNITKSRSSTQPVGQATFQLTAYSHGGKVSWKELPRMSLVEFQVKSPYPVQGSAWRTRFLGYVLEVQDQWNLSATSAERFVTLSCADLMYAFNTQVYYPSNLLISAPTPPKTNTAAIESTLTKLMNAEVMSTALNSNGGTLAYSYIGALLSKFNKSPVNTAFFMAPSTAFWALIQWIMPIFFNPTAATAYAGGGGYATWQNWITGWIVPSLNYVYSSTYAMSEASWWENMTNWFNLPFFESFGDIRDPGETSDLLIVDPLVQGSNLLFGNPNLTNGPAFEQDYTRGGSVSVAGKSPSTSPLQDGAGGSFALVYRNTPFTPSNWDQLIMTTEGDVITNWQMTRSTTDIVNVIQAVDSYWLQSGQLSSALIQVFMPTIFDDLSVSEYGIAPPLQVQVGAISATASSKTNKSLVDFMLSLSMVAWAWYHQNPNFWTGTCVIKGDPRLRVGQRIFFSTENVEGYIEQIVESASLLEDSTQPYQMQLTISRGMTKNVKAAVQEDWNTMTKELPASQRHLLSGFAPAKQGG